MQYPHSGRSGCTADSSTCASRPIGQPRFEDGKAVTLVELAHNAVQLAGGRAPEWIERLEAITEADVAGVLGGVRGLSDIRRTFMAEVLRENRRRLVT